MSEPTMPSERVSRERREAVAKAIDEQALEAAAKALYTSWLGGPGAACMEPWDDDEDDEADYQDVARNDVRTAITAYLTAAPPERHDAPGVSEREAQKRIWHYRDCYQAWSAAPDDDSSRPLYSKYREAERQLLALLTAAPPERHDAPGVSVDIGALSTAILTALDSGPYHQANRWSNISYALKTYFGTGQPDAGRDPDAADAGGE